MVIEADIKHTVPISYLLFTDWLLFHFSASNSYYIFRFFDMEMASICVRINGFTEWLWENDSWLWLYFLVNPVPADKFACLYIRTLQHCYSTESHSYWVSRRDVYHIWGRLRVLMHLMLHSPLKSCDCCATHNRKRERIGNKEKQKWKGKEKNTKKTREDVTA